MIENQYFFIRFRTTRYYYFFSITQLGFALCLLGCYWLRISGFFLEMLSALLLSGDLLVRYFSEGNSGFLNKRINGIDFGVLIAMWLVIVLELFSDGFSISADEVSFALLSLRYGVQFYRVCALIRQAKDSGEIRGMPEIALDMNFEESCLESLGAATGKQSKGDIVDIKNL